MSSYQLGLLLISSCLNNFVHGSRLEHTYTLLILGFVQKHTCFTSGLIPNCVLRSFRLASRRPLLMNDRSAACGLDMFRILFKIASSS